MMFLWFIKTVNETDDKHWFSKRITVSANKYHRVQDEWICCQLRVMNEVKFCLKFWLAQIFHVTKVNWYQKTNTSDLLLSSHRLYSAEQVPNQPQVIWFNHFERNMMHPKMALTNLTYSEVNFVERLFVKGSWISKLLFSL